MSRHYRDLVEKAEELAQLAQSLTEAAIQRNFHKMSLDVTAITAATTELVRIAGVASTGEAADVAAAVAASQAADQSTLDAASAPLTEAVAQLTTLFPPASGGTAPAALVITTTSLPDVTVGSPYAETIATNGGTSPVTVTGSGLPGGLGVDAAGAISGTTSDVPETLQAVFTATDSATPPSVVTVTIPMTVVA
jgi:hypothetical protein